eukprot:TRINITY_DN2511_c0_g1_i3.p1 TRINITY_DN2511_c0_g1~~TRINITY_DN2511_c0_g1_i3.p1  ORF type:complete len:565 (+),score=94.31 TRINITY_DN2511_c0_g1_i3:2617-4311(+)
MNVHKPSLPGRIYAKIGDPSVRQDLEQRRFDAAQWVQWFEVYKKEGNRECMREMRKLIQFQTINYFNKMKYPLPNGTVVPICENLEVIVNQAASTKHYDFERVYEFFSEISPPFSASGNPIISVLPRDCLEVALFMKQHLGLNPLVLNMASPKRPGGGFRNGSGAQEENLFRRTNYFQILEDLDKFDKKRTWRYPLGEFSAVYSPSVFVIRESEANGYALLPSPVEMSFIAMAAYRGPPCHVVKGVYSLTQSMVDGTRRKIRGMLQIARENGHDSLVFSAFGCGVFKNPAAHMAAIFKEVIEEEEWQGYFKHIAIAIIEDHNSKSEMNPEGNYLPFQKAFPGAQKKFENEEDCKGNQSCEVQKGTQVPSPDNTKKRFGAQGRGARGRKENGTPSGATSFSNTQTGMIVKEADTRPKLGESSKSLLTEDIPKDAIVFNLPQEPYGCFSSSFKANFSVNFKKFPSVEHFMQYHKNSSEDVSVRENNLRILSVVKMLDASKSLKVRNDWDSVSDSLLREATNSKFIQNPHLLSSLLETGERHLVDGGDKEGENTLGKLLMEIRERNK